MKTKICLVMLIVAALIVNYIPVIAQPTFTDNNRTPITELFELPDFSVINSREEAWANVLHEIDRIAWEFMANNPEFVAYAENLSAEDDEVAERTRFLPLPQLSPDMHMARDLNAADGMNLVNRTLNLELGRQATDRATSVYPNDLCRQDTLRHFMWSRLAAQTFGAQSARMVTNNHEWANAIGAHFGRQDYRNTALTILRRQGLFEIAWVQLGEPDESMGFKYVFDDDNIHDFWNNRAGINSVGDGFTDPVDAFREAESQGNLIMSDNDVTEDNTMDIFNSRWPFHSSMYIPYFSSVIPGDVNDDGVVNITDVLILFQYLNGHITLTSRGRYAADVNRDGRVGVEDILLILEYLNTSTQR